jgi:hypothetical protein
MCVRIHMYYYYIFDLLRHSLSIETKYHLVRKFFLFHVVN